MEQLTRKAGAAFFLLVGRKMWGVLVNLVVMAILARKLNADDFGVVAVSNALLNIVASLGGTGVSEYLIFQKEADEKKVLNTAFWLNLLICTVLTIAVLLILPFWSSLYEASDIRNITLLLLVHLNATFIASIPLGIFRKQLHYRTPVMLETASNALINIGKIGCVFAGLGVYSLVLPVAVFTPVYVLLLYRYAGFVPSSRLDRQYLRPIWNYVKFVSLSNILNKLVNEGDNLIVGKVLDLKALGIYSLAFNLANLINVHLVPIITNISMPILSKVRDDMAELRARFTYMIRSIAIFTIPLFTLLLLTLTPVVLILYGDKWQVAIPLAQILIVAGIFRTVSSPSTILYNALGKPEYGLYFNLVFGPVFLLGVLLSAPYGLAAVCMAVASLRIVGGQVNIIVSSRMAQSSYWQLYKNMMPVALNCLVSGAAAWAFQGLLPEGSTPVWMIVQTGCLFMIVHILTYRFFFPKTWQEILGIIQKSALQPMLDRYLKK